MNEERQSDAWYARWFGKDYLSVYKHRNEAEAIADVDGIERILGKPLGEPILDLACGSGRHSIELARRGYTVTGIDLSADLLDVARKKAAEEGLKIDFIRGDMRQPPEVNCYRTVINMFTSFGYFETDAENARITEAIAKALRTQGSFVIDYINREQVIATLVEEDEKELEGFHLHQQRRFDTGSQRLEKTITMTPLHGGNSRTYVESVRLYTLAEMQRMVENAGLELLGIYGHIDGRTHTDMAPRVVLAGILPG